MALRFQLHDALRNVLQGQRMLLALHFHGTALRGMVAQLLPVLCRFQCDLPALAQGGGVAAAFCRLPVHDHDAPARLRLLVGEDALVPGKAFARWRAFLALSPELSRHGLLPREVDLRFENRIVLKAPGADAARGDT